MRSVSVRACGVALLIFLVVVTAVPAFAENPQPGTETPQTRIQPPVGVTADDPAGIVLQGHIHVPGGLTSPPEEPLSVWELFFVWLKARI